MNFNEAIEYKQQQTVKNPKVEVENIDFEEEEDPEEIAENNEIMHTVTGKVAAQ